MQITSRINKLLLISLIYLLPFQTVLASENRIEFLDTDNQPINIFARNKLVEVSRAKKKIRLDRESRQILTRMDSILVISNKTFLLGSQQYFWAFIRLPSKESQGAGFCGAGREDYFALFRIQPSSLYLIDKFLAQSCLNSTSIEVDDTAEVEMKISFSRESGLIQFSQEVVKDESVHSKAIKLTPMSSKILVQSFP